MLITIDLSAVILYLIVSDPIWKSRLIVRTTDAWESWRKRSRVARLLNKIEYVFDKYNLTKEVTAKV